MDVLSADSIKILVDNYGGSSIYIPKQVDSNHRLAKEIGLDESRRLSRSHSGEYFFIPKVHKINMDSRNIKIALRYVAGESVSVISHDFNLCDRAVNLIINEVMGRKNNLN